MQQVEKDKSFLFAVVSLLALVWMLTVAEAKWKRIVLLYLIVFILVRWLLNRLGVNPRSPVIFPTYTQNPLAGALSALVVGGYYLLVGSSLLWMVISLILIAGGLHQAAKCGILAVLVTKVIRSLRASYSQGAVADGELLYVIIGGYGTFGSRFLRVFGMQLFTSLWEFSNVADVLQASWQLSTVLANAEQRVEYLRQHPAGSVETMGRAFVLAHGVFPALWRTLFAGRVSIGYLVWSDLEMYPKGFREYVAEFASVFIGVLPMSGQAVCQVLKLTPSWADVPQVDAKALLETVSTDSRIGKVLLGNLRRRIDEHRPRIASEEQDLLRLMHYCRGPAILVLPEIIDAPFHEAIGVLNGYTVVSNWKRETRGSGSRSPAEHCVLMPSDNVFRLCLARRIASDCSETGGEGPCTCGGLLPAVPPGKK